ncbi:glycine cleavage system protein R [Motilibacter aurantiacus]|uniref:glycine cleavage system protein R n=1 Tax=Motilibacter aurantiacus TaxID=2714955 RepID=UPI00140E19FB|nr:ACT domain-containing protein [Motilibacter aurantiacus]NHC45838.1 amino acid-binding protein [Motilibacter aurantiacus]
MPLLAVTVLGADRPGIVAEVTGHLSRLGGNLEDSTMTLLRGHFAMLLVVATDRPIGEVEQALAPVAADGTLDVAVRPVPESTATGAPGAPHLLSVHGGDRPGIVSSMLGVVARVGGNVTDLTTRLSGDLYVVVAEVDLPAGTDTDALASALRAAADELDVDVSLRAVDADLL